MNFRVNRQIRAPKARVIGPEGNQIGVISVRDALTMAQEAGLDLVEIAPNAEPPVCKIIDYGKFRYDQTKREKESKKIQHQVRVKEIKLKPNIDEHDFQTKLKRAQGFLEKGNKVKVTCMFRGREMAYPQLGQRVVNRMCAELEEIAHVEAPAKMMGRSMICVLAPQAAKGKKKEKPHAKDENQ
ncbi:MAG: Translation initiation factor IF-3 [Chlamydiales bacterium]|nr:Translation initiation factor IF-3 [Chlamydiales bacterium]